MRQMSVLDVSRRHVGSDVQVSQKGDWTDEDRVGSTVLAVPGTAERVCSSNRSGFRGFLCLMPG